MNRPTNRFQRGSGLFQCSSCSRKTRDTGGDNTDVGLCEECYEIAGIENKIADEGETPELLAETKRLTALCISKGGKLISDCACGGTGVQPSIDPENEEGYEPCSECAPVCRERAQLEFDVNRKTPTANLYLQEHIKNCKACATEGRS